MQVPQDLRYSAEHEWVRVDGSIAEVGITDFAQDNLGDIVYVQLPEVGAALTRSAVCSEVESTKSVSDIYAPVTGTVTAVNEALVTTPELVNSDPYGAGWLFKIKLDAGDQLPPGLLSAAEYTALTAEQE
jgi:glycine cleavage system H protein